MKFKNCEIWLSAYIHLCRWAMLFELDVEWYHKDYTEINLTILCFTFMYNRASGSFLTKLNKLTDKS